MIPSQAGARRGRQRAAAPRFSLLPLLAVLLLGAGPVRLGAEEAQRKLDFRRHPAASAVPAPYPATTPAPAAAAAWLVDAPQGFRGSSICHGNVGYGPLFLSSQSPFQALRLGFIPRTPSTLERGERELRVNSTWANVWARNPGDYLLDYESLHSEVALGYGFTDTIQVEVALSERSRFGGAQDGFIQGFHDAFNLRQDGRDQVAKDTFQVSLAATDEDPAVALDNSDRGAAARGVCTTFQHNVTCGAGALPAFSYALTARLGDSEDLTGGSFLDLGASISASRRFGPWYAYLSVGYTRFGDDLARGVDLRNTQVAGLAAFEWRYAETSSILLQYLVSEGGAEHRAPFDASSHELSLGWKREVAAGTVVELGLLENILVFDNSPDFGLFFGVTRRF